MKQPSFKSVLCLVSGWDGMIGVDEVRRAEQIQPGRAHSVPAPPNPARSIPPDDHAPAAPPPNSAGTAARLSRS